MNSGGAGAGGSEGSGRATREERRRRSESAILAAARELFAEAGYERATIRAVAARAGVDPALVMQRFGSKEGLFAASARWATGHDRLAAAPRERIAQAVLDELLGDLEDPAVREAALALLRSSLTHPEAMRVVRDEVFAGRQEALAAAIGGEDAALRAELLGALGMAVMMARHLLEVPAVARAGREELERVLRPALEALVGPAQDAADSTAAGAGGGPAAGARSANVRR